MVQQKERTELPTCARCGALAHLRDARFCWRCGAELAGPKPDIPAWQRPATAEYDPAAMPRMALSCPECGEPLSFGFRQVCRRCGAELRLVRKLWHRRHYQVFVAGSRAYFAYWAKETCIGLAEVALFFLALALISKL